MLIKKPFVTRMNQRWYNVKYAWRAFVWKYKFAKVYQILSLDSKWERSWKLAEEALSFADSDQWADPRGTAIDLYMEKVRKRIVKLNYYRGN